MPARLGKGLRIHVPVGDVGHEHAAKKENLGCEKGPHAQGGCLPLLGHVLKLLGERESCLSHAAPPLAVAPRSPVNTHRDRRSLRACAKNYVSAAGMRFAIPSRSRSRDWRAPCDRVLRTRADK